MPPVSNNAETAVAAERPNIFCPPEGPGGRDAGGAGRVTADAIFAAPAQPLPGLALGTEAPGETLRRPPRVSIRVSVTGRAAFVAGALALALALAAVPLAPHGEQALPNRGGHEPRSSSEPGQTQRHARPNDVFLDPRREQAPARRVSRPREHRPQRGPRPPRRQPQAALPAAPGASPRPAAGAPARPIAPSVTPPAPAHRAPVPPRPVAPAVSPSPPAGPARVPAGAPPEFM